MASVSSSIWYNVSGPGEETSQRRFLSYIVVQRRPKLLGYIENGICSSSVYYDLYTIEIYGRVMGVMKGCQGIDYSNAPKIVSYLYHPVNMKYRVMQVINYYT